jgi:hypothetical protein
MYNITIDVTIFAKNATSYAGRKFMECKMKILNRKILSSGNYRRILLGIFYFSFFIVEIFVWYNFPEGRLNQQVKTDFTLVMMSLIALVKQVFISEVTIPDKGMQSITVGLPIFPVSRKEILWSHFKSVLVTQTILTILLIMILLFTQKGLALSDLIWLIALFAIPLLVVGMADKKLLKRD